MQWNVAIAGPFIGTDDRLAIMLPPAVFLYLADLLYLQGHLSHNSSPWHPGQPLVHQSHAKMLNHLS
jgi:hypothetical protein